MFPRLAEEGRERSDRVRSQRGRNRTLGRTEQADLGAPSLAKCRKLASPLESICASVESKMKIPPDAFWQRVGFFLIPWRKTTAAPVPLRALLPWSHRDRNGRCQGEGYRRFRGNDDVFVSCVGCACGSCTGSNQSADESAFAAARRPPIKAPHHHRQLSSPCCVSLAATAFS